MPEALRRLLTPREDAAARADLVPVGADGPGLTVRCIECEVWWEAPLPPARLRAWAVRLLRPGPFECPVCRSFTGVIAHNE